MGKKLEIQISLVVCLYVPTDLHSTTQVIFCVHIAAYCLAMCAAFQVVSLFRSYHTPHYTS